MSAANANELDNNSSPTLQPGTIPFHITKSLMRKIMVDSIKTAGRMSVNYGGNELLFREH